MSIMGIANAGYGGYAFGSAIGTYGDNSIPTDANQLGISGTAASGVNGSGASGVSTVSTSEDVSAAEEKTLKRMGKLTCQTCANRKYQDGSNEGDVSFKAPGHISPQASGATVASHEREHVANAYQKASGNNGQVLQASVTFKMGICPECGRSYVAGGQTNTTIRYSQDDYGQNRKTSDAANGAVGANFDMVV